MLGVWLLGCLENVVGGGLEGLGLEGRREGGYLVLFCFVLLLREGAVGDLEELVV